MTTNAAGWHPTSEAEIEAAIRSGDLKENRHLDVKREVGSGDSSRKETARDIASLAIAGGALLVGVEEQPKDQFTLAPFDLTGEAERLEQVAANRIDPPVLVLTREIASESSPGKGYLWVEVPPSSLAPHMVDGAYWGRADKTKAKLTDPQVVQLHSRRESHVAHINTLLDEEIDRDPVEIDSRQCGHLYMVAWPIQARPDAALSVFTSQDPHSILWPILNSAEGELDGRSREFAPGPTYAASLRRRAHGLAFTSLEGTQQGRRLDAERGEQNAVDVEFREDGGIRVFMGRMTANWREDVSVIADGLAVAYARRLVRWTAEYARLWGYPGPWGLGVAASGLRGLSSNVHLQGFNAGPVYDRDTYRSVTTAFAQDLEQAPWRVAERLVGRLVRGVGTQHYYAADLQEPAQLPNVV